jgi:hypothetical protein
MEDLAEESREPPCSSREGVARVLVGKFELL